MTDVSKNVLLASRRANDKAIASLNRTHEVLNDPNLDDDEKFFTLITELGFGKIRAQELVYGKVKFTQKYESTPYTKDFSTYYKEVK